MPSLKTGMENGMFWSEIVSGFGELGGTVHPHHEFQGVLPSPPPPQGKISVFCAYVGYIYLSDYGFILKCCYI